MKKIVYRIDRFGETLAEAKSKIGLLRKITEQLKGYDFIRVSAYEDGKFLVSATFGCNWWIDRLEMGAVTAGGKKIADVQRCDDAERRIVDFVKKVEEEARKEANKGE